MRAFHFVTHWSFDAPLARVFAEIGACDRYASWWKGFEKSEAVGDDVAQRVQGMFGMRLSFVQQRITRDAPYAMSFSSRGDLVGEGVWDLVAIGTATRVTFTWDVDLGRRRLRLLTLVPGMRALMTRSHDGLMRQGEACLATLLRGSSSIPTRTHSD